ncbi:hypothetical protein [Streptomyces capitiformicae]|uniref:hypothetical protein n=1 Tax=Streptomyces capitiformicae TaxID=2014920 RepID=UPI001AD7ECE7|nr:hypothetical protein [Streptomyces capitiformicae]
MNAALRDLARWVRPEATGTALHETDATFDFGLADWDRDGRPDLVALKKSNTGTNSTEVHILGG